MLLLNFGVTEVENPNESKSYPPFDGILIDTYLLCSFKY
jgi:hypothetical protein